MAESSQQPATVFPREMLDRQARGKNPYRPASDDSSDDDGGLEMAPLRRSGAPKNNKNKQSFAVSHRRRLAGQILNSPELLLMAALRDGETVPYTRLKYTRIFYYGEDGSADLMPRIPSQDALLADPQRQRPGMVLGKAKAKDKVKDKAKTKADEKGKGKEMDMDMDVDTEQ
ncbi:hypothetical protein F4802DRAFT_551653 [Xylaria palmicola]|nr:hypothetical protein F4802DRAFT_551653 [Xylaria palmicola]